MPAGTISIVSVSGSVVGSIPATGTQLSFANILYRYASLSLPYSPNDPGLSYTYDNSTLAPSVILFARFFNLLNETSLTFQVDVGSAAANLQSTATCLDPRMFGAIGDGVADDTVAVQAALDQARANVLSGIGTTIVCIPSGEYCMVTPSGVEGQDRGFAPYYVSDTSVDCGATCLWIDSGVTLRLDGALILGSTPASIARLTSWGQFTGSGIWATNEICIIENRNAFIRGPFAMEQVDRGQLSIDVAVAKYETGPRDQNIRITGGGVFDCGQQTYYAIPTAFPYQLNAVTTGAVRFIKCDDSILETVTIKNAAAALRWGFSRGATMQQLNFDDLYVDSYYTFSIYLLTLRDSKFIQNTMLNWEGATANGCSSGLIGWANNTRTDCIQNEVSYGGWGAGDTVFYLQLFDFVFSGNGTWVFGSSQTGPYQWGVTGGGGTGFISPLRSAFLSSSVNPPTLIHDFDMNLHSNRFINNRGKRWKANNVFPGISAGRKHCVVSTSYTTGDCLFALELPFLSQPVVTGATEPNWAGVQIGDTVVDGTAIWRNWGNIQQLWVNNTISPATPFILLTGPCTILKLVGTVNGDIGGNFPSANLPSAGVRVALNHITGNNALPILFEGLSFGQIAQNYIVNNMTTTTTNPVPIAAQCDLFPFGSGIAENSSYLGGTKSSPSDGTAIINNYVQANGPLQAVNVSTLSGLTVAGQPLVPGQPSVGGPFPQIGAIDSVAAAFWAIPTSQLTINNSQVTSLVAQTGGVVTQVSNPFTETPGGLLDGVNTQFTLTYIPIVGSLQVFVNGLLVSNYTAGSNSIFFNVAPAPTDVLSATYLH
jgi:hypothetical protein